MRSPLTQPQRLARTQARTPLGACHLRGCSHSPRLGALRWGDAGAGGRFLLAKRCFWACGGALPFSPGSGSHSRFLPSRCFLPRPRPFLLDSDILPWVGGSGTDARRAVWDGLRSPLLPCAAPPLPAAPVPERGACLIGGHTLRGRGAASLNSSPPAPAALIPPPHWRRGWRGGGRRASCGQQALSPAPSLPRPTERARQEQRPNRVPQTSS